LRLRSVVTVCGYARLVTLVVTLRLVTLVTTCLRVCGSGLVAARAPVTFWLLVGLRLRSLRTLYVYRLPHAPRCYAARIALFTLYVRSFAVVPVTLPVCVTFVGYCSAGWFVALVPAVYSVLLVPFCHLRVLGSTHRLVILHAVYAPVTFAVYRARSIFLSFPQFFVTLVLRTHTRVVVLPITVTCPVATLFPHRLLRTVAHVVGFADGCWFVLRLRCQLVRYVVHYVYVPVAAFGYWRCLCYVCYAVWWLVTFTRSLRCGYAHARSRWFTFGFTFAVTLPLLIPLLRTFAPRWLLVYVCPLPALRLARTAHTFGFTAAQFDFPVARFDYILRTLLVRCRVFWFALHVRARWLCGWLVCTRFTRIRVVALPRITFAVRFAHALLRLFRLRTTYHFTFTRLILFSSRCYRLRSVVLRFALLRSFCCYGWLRVTFTFFIVTHTVVRFSYVHVGCYAVRVLLRPVTQYPRLRTLRGSVCYRLITR